MVSEDLSNRSFSVSDSGGVWAVLLGVLISGEPWFVQNHLHGSSLLCTNHPVPIR